MAILLGVLATFFFSMTFVLNQVMATGGGDWLWTASLRFFLMIPFFLLIVSINKQSSLSKTIKALKDNKMGWGIWSQVAFTFFYVPLCFASTLAPGWLVASTWQITIIAGSLIAPLIETNTNLKKNSHITLKEIIFFFIILLGIVLIETQHITATNQSSLILALLAVLVAAFSYPLGNRKIMMLNHDQYQLNTDERILAMLLASIPSWILCAILAFFRSGLPTQSQIFSSFLVAIFSGVIATYLFFKATQLSYHNLRQLATIEATQSLEVVFSLLLGILFLKDQLPSLITLIGLFLVILGMTLKVLRS